MEGGEIIALVTSWEKDISRSVRNNFLGRGLTDRPALTFSVDVMAKWLKDYLSFGSKRVPPQPPKPDYTESEILKAYRVQKNLDFEDPYDDTRGRAQSESTFGSPLKSASLDMKLVSPKHRLIKVDSQDLGRSKIFLSAVSLEESAGPVVPSAPVAGNTDYSDPFDVCLDTQLGSELRPAPAENNGYMEPYEAQRVITELQRVHSAGCSMGGIQLYDTPYEERRRGELAEEGRESRLPQDDERPADEYDQPWEWKKDHISKAFAVQFDGADWDHSSSPPEHHRLPRSTPLGGAAAKLRKLTDPHVVLGERVDPTLPLEKQVGKKPALMALQHQSLKQCME
ncbi:SH2 domain-containing adapter protein F-like isoform X3 [Arapaima gigas]